MRYLQFTALALMLSGPLALADPAATDRSAVANRNAQPVLVELFTSQSCSSCPRAEAVFSDLAEREDLIIIQWHVDYWDNLVHGRDGKWKDPYSRPAHTQRQRDYNYALRGTGSVYTPQAVVGGVLETVGSRRAVIEDMIADAPKADADINVSLNGSGMMVSVAPNTDGRKVEAEVMLVELVAEQTNEILGGENRGRTANSRNVAISSDTLGGWDGANETYRARRMTDSHDCAVFVQEKGTGRILGAAYCPSVETNSDTNPEPAPVDFIGAHP